MKKQDGIQVECDWLINKTLKYDRWVSESILSKSTKNRKYKNVKEKKNKKENKNTVQET